MFKLFMLNIGEERMMVDVVSHLSSRWFKVNWLLGW